MAMSGKEACAVKGVLFMQIKHCCEGYFLCLSHDWATKTVSLSLKLLYMPGYHTIFKVSINLIYW